MTEDTNPLLPKPRETWVELFSGDFEPRLQELRVALGEATEKEQATKRLGSPKSESLRLAQEYDALVEEARASGVVKMRLRAAGRKWRQVKDNHPPREDNVEDGYLGINRTTFFDEAVKLCIIEPDFTAEQYDAFVEGASSVHWDRICNAAWYVNEGDDSIPKSSAVSLLRQLRDDASKSAESTGSTPARSTAKRSSSATTTTAGV